MRAARTRLGAPILPATFARIARSVFVTACIATLLPSIAQALDFRIDPLGSTRPLQAAGPVPPADRIDRVGMRASASWGRHETSRLVGNAIGTALATPIGDSSFIENAESNAGVLLGLGLLGLTARRYRSC